MQACSTSGLNNGGTPSPSKTARHRRQSHSPLGILQGSTGGSLQSQREREKERERAVLCSDNTLVDKCTVPIPLPCT